MPTSIVELTISCCLKKQTNSETYPKTMTKEFPVHIFLKMTDEAIFSDLDKCNPFIQFGM